MHSAAGLGAIRRRFNELGFIQLGRPFRLLLGSELLMTLSIMVSHVTVPWWIAQQGGAHDLAWYAALLAGVSFVALPLLSPLGDRHAKRTLMTVGLGVMLIESTVMAMLAHTGLYRIDGLIVLAALTVVAMAVIMPASQSIVADLLPSEQLTEGLGYQKSAQAIGRLMGPVIGGVSLAMTSIATTLWLNAALLLVACVLAARIVVPATAENPRSGAHWWADLQAGMAAKWKIPMERGWTFTSFLVVIFFGPCVGMLVPLKVQSLGLSSVWLGACEAGLSVGLLVGALGGSVWVAHRTGRYLASLGAILCEGVAFVIAGWTHQALVLVVMLTIVGACISTVQMVGQTHRMLAMPQQFRARMTSVNLMVMQLAGVLGPGLAGLGLAAYDVDAVYLVFGIALFVVGLGYRRVPGYQAFLNQSHEEATGFYEREYPALFQRTPPQQSGG